MIFSDTRHRQSWPQLLSIQSGAAFSLPMIMIGQIICDQYGWNNGLIAIGAGNLFLLLTALGYASLSIHRPQSTVKHAIHYFGIQGRFLLAGLMMASLLGWFAVQLNIMSLSLEQLFEQMNTPFNSLYLNILIGALLSCVLCFGMGALKWLSNIAAPLLALTLIYVLVTAKGGLPGAKPFTISLMGGLSFIIGGCITAIVDLPNFFQHAKSKKDALIAVVLLYAIVIPFIEAVGLYLAATVSGKTILDLLMSGHGFYWVLWLCLFVFLCGWMANNANLWSATWSSQPFFKEMSFKARTLLLGGFGTAVACFNPMNHFDIVLDILAITMGSMGAVILTNYFLELITKEGIKRLSFVSWTAGIAVGLMAQFAHLSLTKAAVFDAFIVAACAQMVATFMSKRTHKL